MDLLTPSSPGGLPTLPLTIRILLALVENVFVLSMPVRLGTLDILQRCALQIYILLLLRYLCRHWHTAVDEKRE